MILPWVSRAWHVEVVDILNARISGERETNHALRRELTDLIGKYHQLRLSGQVPVLDPVLPSAREVDPLRGAILARAGGDRRLIQIGLAQLQHDRDSGLDDDAILAAIGGGQASDGEEGLPS